MDMWNPSLNELPLESLVYETDAFMKRKLPKSRISASLVTFATGEYEQTTQVEGFGSGA